MSATSVEAIDSFTVPSSPNAINDLIAMLREENAALAKRLKLAESQRTLPDHQTFSLFPKLPMELRTKIWIIALTEPQIHRICALAASRSRVNTVMSACREARQACIDLHIPYFTLLRSYLDPVFKRGDFLYGGVRNYINPGVDTLWPDGELYQRIVFFCPKCNGYFQFCREGSHPRPRAWFDRVKCECKHRLFRFAINRDEWNPPIHLTPDYPNYQRHEQLFGSAQSLVGSFRVENIVIVLSRQRVSQESNVTFIVPRFAIDGEVWQEGSEEELEDSPGLTDSEYIQRLRHDCEKWRANYESLVQGIPHEAEKEKAKDPGQMRPRTFFQRLVEPVTQWEIPRIEYVAARCTDSQWRHFEPPGQPDYR